MQNRSFITYLAYLIFAVCLFSSLAMAGDIQQRIEDGADRVKPQVLEWRRHLHSHPELSNREVETGKFIAERLKEIGVDDIKTNVAHNGVVALIKGEKSGPTVALRADIDALPVTEQTGLPFASRHEGVMHACGHDCHTSVLLGTAKVLCQMRDVIPGTVKLIFQPAEEGAPLGERGGASLMIEENVLKDPGVSAIFALHVNSDLETGKVSYRLGSIFASVDQFKVTIKGKQTHAAMPWQGVDPIVTSAHVITALQTIVSREVDARDPAVLTVGVIQGGQRWNIIPESVTLEGTIRTHDTEVRKQIKEAFFRIINSTCEAHGASAEIIFHDYGTVTYNDPDLGQAMIPSLQEAAGPDNVKETRPLMGGEDFASFAQVIPGFYVLLGVRNEALGAVHPVHSPHFIADEEALPVGVRVMTHFAIDYLILQDNKK